eukprot:Blabericola_migrator_1__891@NODE_121_length_13441_cov_57_998280_g108_i0_p1_GENE_NODE_121_length_13441_cov_57_998280_g108_i0NODE_121_length_13441_cov_57_998280_g108_i0_p1_ORF_typecomplete_len2492_score354_43MATH/PF00917_26/4_1e09DUF1858/PF08984_11/0_25_NODE_121_length_13441_cov_57_998280_g108_i01077582
MTEEDKLVVGGDPTASGVVEFALPNFWKLIKQQKDIESPQIGFSHGFYFRILVHPRGTVGTDSESSHLSVFLEALKQPWFPDDWVFPNVRFDLTVVNWKDPKESVNSWAHWTFCEDTTSRGWQRMLPQSKISRAKGFLNDEDTLLVRGKAEPVFWGPWSRRRLTFLPKNIWDFIPSSPYTGEEFSVAKKGRLPLSAGREEIWDSLVPTLSPALHCDALACIVHILFHIKEFRRLVCAWRPKANDESSFMSTLQLVFARMHLWPLVVGAAAEMADRGEGSLSPTDKSLRELLAAHNSVSAVPANKTVADIYAKQASCKEILKALGLHCVQRMTFNDPFVEFHQKIFAAVHKECQLDYIADLTDVVHSGIQTQHRDRVPQSLKLDKLLEQLFSIDCPEQNVNRIGDGIYAHSFVKIRHVQSVSKALEANGKRLNRLPDILPIYMSPQKTIRKGELFDVPLRLDPSSLLVGNEDEEESCDASRKGKWYSLYALVIKDGDSGAGGYSSNASMLSASNGFSILLRPEEEGPWFRISDGRVERLISKVSFAEWKCHRDFFASAAIYVSEEYIDTSVSHPVDLSCLNPALYARALKSFDLPPTYLDAFLRDDPMGTNTSQHGDINFGVRPLPPMETDGEANTAEAAGQSSIPQSCFSPFWSCYSKQSSGSDTSSSAEGAAEPTPPKASVTSVSPLTHLASLDRALVKLPEFPTLDKISKYGQSAGPATSLVSSRAANSIRGPASQRFYDKVRSLLTDSITRRDAASLNAILAEVFNVTPKLDSVETEGPVLDAAVLSWTLTEASKRALDVALAVDCYLGSGLWEPDGGTYMPPNLQQSNEAFNTDLLDSRDDAKNACVTASSLEDWVTRQVSIVWDLLARVDSYRHQSSNTKTAPFADVFCLAILESVEIRVLRNALLPAHPADQPEVIGDQCASSPSITKTQTPKQHMRLTGSPPVLPSYGSPRSTQSLRNNQDLGYRGAKRKCSTAVLKNESVTCSSARAAGPGSETESQSTATGGDLHPTGPSGPGVPPYVSKSSCSSSSSANGSASSPSSEPASSTSPFYGNLLYTGETAQPAITQVGSFASQHGSHKGDTEVSASQSKEKVPAQTATDTKRNYAKLFDLLQKSKPSKSTVLCVCYGSIAASRRAHQATLRDLLRLRRRFEPAPANAVVGTSQPALHSRPTTGTSVPNQGKRRRSEVVGFCANCTAAVVSLPRSNAPSPATNAVSPATRSRPSPGQTVSLSAKSPLGALNSTSNFTSCDTNRHMDSQPCENHKVAQHQMDSGSIAERENESLGGQHQQPDLLENLNEFILSPALLTAADLCLTSPTSGSKRVKVTVIFESNLAGCRGSLPSECRGNSSATSSEDRTSLYLNDDVSCSVVYSLICKALHSRLSSPAEAYKVYDAFCMVSHVAMENARHSRLLSPKPCGAPRREAPLSNAISIFLYALNAEDGSGHITTMTDSIHKNKSRHKITFLDPLLKLSHYIVPQSVDSSTQTPPSISDLQLLVCLGGVLGESAKPPQKPKSVKSNKKGKKRIAAITSQVRLEPEVSSPEIPHATAKDDLAMPLLVFKWFDCEEVDLLWLGAVPCDARLALQDIIGSWVLMRLLVCLPRLLDPLWNLLGVPHETQLKIFSMAKDPQEWTALGKQMDSLLRRLDLTSICVVVEEQFLPGNSWSRDFQNIRRFNSSIRKLNKKTSETIVVQWRFGMASPPPQLSAWGSVFLSWVKRVGVDAIAEALSCGSSLDEQSERLWRLLYERTVDKSEETSFIPNKKVDNLDGTTSDTPDEVAHAATQVFMLANEKYKLRTPIAEGALQLTQSPDTIAISPSPSTIETAPPLSHHFSNEFSIEVSPGSAPLQDVTKHHHISLSLRKSHKRKNRVKCHSKYVNNRKGSSGVPPNRRPKGRKLIQQVDFLDDLAEDEESTSSDSQSSIMAASLSPASNSSCDSSKTLFKKFETAWKTSRTHPTDAEEETATRLIVELFESAQDSLRGSLEKRACLTSHESLCDFNPSKGIFIPSFKHCISEVFRAFLSEHATSLPAPRALETRILDAIVHQLHPLTPADLSSSQGWPAAVWASQLELLARFSRTGLDSTFRSEFPTSFISTLQLSILSSINTAVDEELALESSTPPFSMNDEVAFFQSCLDNNSDLLVMVELLSGLFSVSPTFGNRRLLRHLTFSSLNVFYHLASCKTDAEVLNQSSILIVKCCVLPFQRHLIVAYQVAISVCYILFLTLYALPSIFNGSHRSFGFGLNRRLGSTLAFTHAVSKRLNQKTDPTRAQQTLERWNARLRCCITVIMEAIEHVQQSALLEDLSSICDASESSGHTALMKQGHLEFAYSFLRSHPLETNKENDEVVLDEVKAFPLTSNVKRKSRRWSEDVALMNDFAQPAATETISLSDGEDEDADNSELSSSEGENDDDEFEDVVDEFEDEVELTGEDEADLSSVAAADFENSGAKLRKMSHNGVVTRPRDAYIDKSAVGSDPKRSRLRYAIARE